MGFCAMIQIGFFVSLVYFFIYGYVSGANK